MSAVRPRPAIRLETWLWTGPLGHLVAGTLDWGQALGGYLLGRARDRVRALAGR